MKAEERHELKENDLQSWFQYGFPMWIKRNGSYLLLAAALVLLAYQIYHYYTQKQLLKNQGAWSELFATEDPGVENRAVKLQAIIDQYDINPLRALALRDMGNAYLESVATGVPDDGNLSVPFDKADALARAQAAFERVVKEFPDQTLALGGAKLGLAVVAEDRGDWNAARQQYQALADKAGPFAGSAFAIVAAYRLKDLDKVKDAPQLAKLVPATMPATTAPNLGPIPAGPPAPSPTPIPSTTPTPAPPAPVTPHPATPPK